VRYGFLLVDLSEEIFPELRSVPFKLDSHDCSQTPVHALWVDDRDDALNSADFLELCNAPETRRRGQPNLVRQFQDGHGPAVIRHGFMELRAALL
jgi:hypothetical protein